MSYQVLARKYRPQKFSEVIGQEHVTRTLKNAIAQGRTAHGYIFSGHRGIGKTTVARILAMALNCRSSDKPVEEPCGVCESCTEIRAGNSVDVVEIDAATNRGIDEIRELREGARYRPARDRFKIVILDEAHQITDAAFNALLKTLEEPPDHMVFMLATTQPEDIPQTILSRCQHFSFRAVRFEEIMNQLRDLSARENIPADEDALAMLAEAGDGSMRDALSILDQAIASCDGRLTSEFDNLEAKSYPMPNNLRRPRREVFIGRIREDLSSPNGIAYWCVSDNLRKCRDERRANRRASGPATGQSRGPCRESSPADEAFESVIAWFSNSTRAI